jgi:magnesium chelatase family protein
MTDPPFCAPHHTATKAAMLGGGSGLIRPGAASLAHRGMLFLDDAPEFDRDALDVLRQPLEAGEVVIARSGVTARFPARFILVVAARPCPCAVAASQSAECSCTPLMRRRYLGRLAGPLLDRVALKVEMRPTGRTEMLRDQASAETSQVVAGRVAAARERAARRLEGTPWRLNAEVLGSQIVRIDPLCLVAFAPLMRAMEAGQISERGAHQAARVAWTLADLTGKARPGRDDSALALSFLIGDAR